MHTRSEALYPLTITGFALASACGFIGDSFTQNAQILDASTQPSAIAPAITEADGGAGVDTPTSPASPNRVLPPAQVGWSGIVGTGQSLSVGASAGLGAATPPLPYAFLLADSKHTWDISSPDLASLSLAPLTEPFHPQAPNVSGYPNNIAGMTPHTTMAMEVEVWSQNLGLGHWITVHSATGLSGQPMSAIAPNGSLNAYTAGLFEARALHRLAQERGTALHYDAVILTHGESDAGASTPNYGKMLETMQAAYQKDLRAITGQGNAPIYLIVSQQNTLPNAGAALSEITQAQWQVAIANPQTILCAGPKYQYAYSGDHLHFNEGGYRRLGEKYGQVFAQTVIEGRPYLPLYPLQVTRPDARTVRVTFHVPTPPLNWDPVLPKPHQNSHTAWAQAHGFELRDSQGREVTLAAAKIVADGNFVDLQLDSDHPEALTVAYAMTADADGVQGGLAEGRMGHLRDSDAIEGASAESVVCTATRASPKLVCSQSMAHRVIYDVVNPGGLSIVGFDEKNPKAVTLSGPWAAASGDNEIRVHHEHRNYAVAFWLPCPAL